MTDRSVTSNQRLTDILREAFDQIDCITADPELDLERQNLKARIAAALSGDSSAPETTGDAIYENMDELARDASRYRWLRGHLGAGFAVKQACGDPHGFSGPTLLDEALDIARNSFQETSESRLILTAPHGEPGLTGSPPEETFRQSIDRVRSELREIERRGNCEHDWSVAGTCMHGCGAQNGKGDRA